MNLNLLFFGVYPYIVLTVFLLGCWIRFDRDQYTWKSDSSQLLERKILLIASPLFHVGMIFLFLGHFAGLLTPHSWFTAMGISDQAHQVIAISAGSLFGSLAFIGGIMLLMRRLTNPLVRAAGRKIDVFVLVWILITLTVGIATIPVSVYHALNDDAQGMIILSDWVKSALIMQPDVSRLSAVHWIYKLHLFCGMTLFMIFPFTRLVHIFSLPLAYLTRPYQVVRRRFVRVR
jgi:nitrate reductase gamma subunit